MKNDTWFDKLEVGDFFMHVYEDAISFIYIKISPTEIIIIYDAIPQVLDLTGDIDTRQSLLDHFSKYFEELELNIPKQIKKYFEVK